MWNFKCFDDMSKCLFYSFFVCVLLFVSTTLCAQEIPDSCQLTAEAFYLRIEKDVEGVVLDARSSDEDRQLSIHNAIPVPNSAALTSVLDTIPSFQRVYIYCSYGDRSEQALKFALEHYPTLSIYHLKKGLHRWKKLGYPLDTLAVP